MQYSIGQPVDTPNGHGKLAGVVMREATVSLDAGGFWSGPMDQIKASEPSASPPVQVVEMADEVVVEEELEIIKLGDPETGEPATREEFEEAAALVKAAPEEAPEPLLELPTRMTKKWLEAQDRAQLQRVLDSAELTPARRKRIEDFLRGV